MEQLKHECGVAMIRLRKPLAYYQEKYGTWMYGLNKLYLLMEKQHNRGQEGAGLACVKLSAEPGEEFIYRERAMGSGAISEIFANVHNQINSYNTEHGVASKEQLADPDFAERFVPYAGELYMGHLRYSTTGKSGMSYVHPFLRRNNWRARNLCLCGNFNMTNVPEIFDGLKAIGQHPRIYSDTYIMLEQIGHRLDRESERLYKQAEEQGLRGMEITDYIEHHMDMSNVLRQAAPTWDGGFVICGLTGSGESFAIRDPWGIRPAFWYADEEVMIVASERPVIQTTFNLEVNQIHELMPGEALMMTHDGELRLQQLLEPKRLQACSFERIYFSRGSDQDIYRERKELGRLLYPAVYEAIHGEVEDTVFSFIPNTAETAYYGLCEGFEEHHGHVRREKVVHKDIKLRTFITESESRNDLAAHVYDITYGSVRAGVDNLVVIDDSIVRGTTLKESIIRILDRLHPKRLVIVSSSPQIRYPDYYGIDMSRMSEFIAFKAAIELLQAGEAPEPAGHAGGTSFGEALVRQVYGQCVAQSNLPSSEMQNYVRQIYEPFTDQQIADKMAQMLRAAGVTTEIHIVFQTIEDLHRAIPNHPGDWYFSGDYPTPGGLRLLNQAYIDWYEKEH